jgi:hypothetical protein
MANILDIFLKLDIWVKHSYSRLSRVKIFWLRKISDFRGEILLLGVKK